MSDVPANLQALLQEATARSGMEKEDVDSIEAAIINSPYLADLMSRAVDSGSLKGFAISDKPNEGGHYGSDGLIYLAPNTLRNPRVGPTEQSDLLTVTLGHETSHALRAEVDRKALYEFSYAVKTTLREAVGNESFVDLSEPAQKYLNERRYNEALAEQTGLNALADRVRSEGDGPFNVEEFSRRAASTSPCSIRDGNGKPHLAPGISLNAAGFQNARDPAAVEAIAQCYVETSGTLGKHGNMGYQNYNGGSLIENIAREWRDTDRYARITGKNAPEVGLNLSGLKLDTKLLEQNGLDLDEKTFGFTDTSNGQLKLTTVRHTAPAANQAEPRVEVDLAVEPKTLQAPRADQAGHPDHAAFEAIRSTVRADGRWDDKQSENIAAALLREHKMDPLSHRLDAVVVGRPTPQGDTNVFAVYAPHGTNKEPVFLASVDTAKAAQEPAAGNLDQVNQLNQQRALQQSQTLTQQADAPAHNGPRM